MPIKKAAKKHSRITEKHTTKNRARKRAIHDSIKSFSSLIKENKPEDAKKALDKVQKLLDKAAKKGTLHKNTADRKKANLTKKVNALTKK